VDPPGQMRDKEHQLDKALDHKIQYLYK